MELLIHPIDVAIIVVYLAFTVLLGVWLGRGENSTRGYFLGGKQLPWWALLLSIIASETSTVTFLSIPGLTFKEGGNFGFLQLALGFVVGRMAVAWIILPYYFRGELLTSYELLENKMGVSTRRLASGLFLATRTIGDALRLFLTALVLYKVIHLNLPLCVLVVGVATIVYTFAGGLKSVVWNDCIQFVIYILGAAWALWFLVSAVGGWESVWEFGLETGRLQLFDWNIRSEGVNIWVGIIGGGFLSFATHGTDHMVVQRLLGSRSQPDAKRALLLSGVIVFLQFAFFLVIGLALACFYQTHPPEVVFQSNDEVFVSFIANHLQTGVVGLILAAVFAAALSTQSSSLNSLAGAWVNDFYRPRCGDDNDRKLLWAGKFATIVFGLMQMGVAIFAYLYLMEQRSTVNLVFEIAAFAYGPVLGLFFLSMTKWELNAKRSAICFVCGLLLVIGLKLLTIESIHVIQMNGLWFTMVGSLATLMVGWQLRNRE